MSFRAQQGRKLFDALRNPSRNSNGITSRCCHFLFLQSLPVGLGKKSKFRCRWMLDHSDAKVGTFLDSLLEDMEKQSRFDHLRTRMAEVEGAGPRSILPTPTIPAASVWVSTFSLAPMVAPGPSAGATKYKKKLPKRRKRKVCESVPEDTGLGADAAWEHEVEPLDRAFLVGFNFRAALDTRLTSGPVQEAPGTSISKQLLGTAQGYACKLTACLKVGIENAFAAKLKMEKELAAAKNQGERVSALARISKVEENKAQVVELQSCRSALVQEKKKVESLTQSLEEKQMALGKAEAALDHWCQE
ncbi:hypothetical protein PIB30_095341 [Stylosanthes scabra]|uniref:Uncharacterized protein n=1 Tax=Stylosanthes scabra TaxID=79078 RepID=A0ABU6TVA1_9FABA|nr:hypothetical protein [Stylosanthes scabra]